MPEHTIQPNTTSRARRTLLLGLAALLAGTLGGCLPESEPVQVSLNNRTHSLITATVLLEQAGGEDQTLSRTSIPSGEVTTLGPFAPPSSGRLQLVLDRADQFTDVPTRQRLPRGTSAYEIVNPVFSTYSQIELWEVRPGAQEWTWSERSVGTTYREQHSSDANRKAEVGSDF